MANGDRLDVSARRGDAVASEQLLLARDAAVHALQPIAATWALHPDAETIAALKAAVRAEPAALQRVEHAEQALERLGRLEARLVEAGRLAESQRWMSQSDPSAFSIRRAGEAIPMQRR